MASGSRSTSGRLGGADTIASGTGLSVCCIYAGSVGARVRGRAMANAAPVAVHFRYGHLFTITRGEAGWR